MKGRHPIVAGLDIGSTNVTAVVGEAADHGLVVLGVSSYPGKGLRKGVIVNIETTVATIREALKDVEAMAGCDVETVFAGVCGAHIKSLNSHGMVPMRGGEVTARDVERVLEAASAVAIPTDREILHVLPYEYIVDEQRNIKDPVGMTGVRLEVKCHIVTGAQTNTASVVKCCNQVGATVNEIVFQPYASSLAVLSDSEREVGTVVFDIGGGTSGVAVFREGALIHSSVLALGGGNITNDIAHGLRVPAFPTAERLKVKFGHAKVAEVDPHEEVEIDESTTGARRVVSRQILCEIIEHRCDEILRLLHSELEEADLADAARTGLVITGGCANLPGLARLAGEIFETQVRVGAPANVTGHTEMLDDPRLAGAVGLAIYGREALLKGPGVTARPSGFRKSMVRARDWLKEFF
ncbi:cell division protein FtsA [bacterium]|nr:cell division protein FtsA [bacterium]